MHSTSSIITDNTTAIHIRAIMEKGLRIKRNTSFYFNLYVKGPLCDRSKVYFYVGTHTHIRPNPTHLKLIKSRACRWLDCLGLLFISMPANCLGPVWFCSLLCSSYKHTYNCLRVTIHRLTREDTLNDAPQRLPSFSGTTE